MLHGHAMAGNVLTVVTPVSTPTMYDPAYLKIEHQRRLPVRTHAHEGTQGRKGRSGCMGLRPHAVVRELDIPEFN